MEQQVKRFTEALIDYVDGRSETAMTEVEKRAAFEAVDEWVDSQFSSFLEGLDRSFDYDIDELASVICEYVEDEN